MAVPTLSSASAFDLAQSTKAKLAVEGSCEAHVQKGRPHRTLKPPHWNQPLHPPETWTLPPAQLYVLPSVHAANRLSCLCTSHVIVGGEGDGSI